MRGWDGGRFVVGTGPRLRVGTLRAAEEVFVWFL